MRTYEIANMKQCIVGVDFIHGFICVLVMWHSWKQQNETTHWNWPKGYRLLYNTLVPQLAQDMIQMHTQSLCHFSCADCRSGWLEGPNKVYIPFLACGDLSSYDSDRSYPLPSTEGGSYRSLDPVQPPIAPPYKTALEMKKASSHGASVDTIRPSTDS